MERIAIPDEMKPIIVSYYEDNAKKLCGMVDKILFQLRFADVDKDDFYSLANEVFLYAIRDYNGSQLFDRFLYACLYKKFCTEMTGRIRDKRCGKTKIKEKNENGEITERMIMLPDVSIYSPAGDDESYTVGDMIADEFTIERELFEKDELGYSRKMLLYLDRLSWLQKEVLELNAAGFSPDEIRARLHISKKQYSDCCAAIRSYRNVSVLF